MTVDDILALPPEQFNDKANWDQLDQLIGSLSDAQAQINEWTRILRHAEAINSPTGHPHFRLGILHLLIDADETAGIDHFRLAYESDKRHKPERAHRMAAYRLLSLMQDFLADLTSKTTWHRRQLEPEYRRVLIEMLFVIYDQTAQLHILDMPAHTYEPFFSLIESAGLRLFAGENYMCAQSLLEWVETDSGQSFILTHEYPFARMMVGLYGGVLEALLADKLPDADRMTLGVLINEAYEQRRIVLGTRLCALCIIVLYFRNLVQHAMRTASRSNYFVDRNVAKGLKVATDIMISELLKQSTQHQTRVASHKAP